jgi:hypothetical protein
LVQEEIKNMGMLKRGSIRLMINKESLKKEMSEKDISDYLQIFYGTVDFAFLIGWMDEVKSYEDNLLKWEKENSDWVAKNQKGIKTDIINTIINNLYS